MALAEPGVQSLNDVPGDTARLRPRWIFLDFDGVVMDSMTLKLDAYCFAFEEFGFDREKLREQQLRYAGLSRSRAVPLMFEALAGRSMDAGSQQRVLERFAEEDIRLRPRMRLLPGVEAFFEEAGRRGVPLVVVTGTPQEVIDGTVDLFDLRRHFREVHGYPPPKAERLQDLLDRHGLAPRETIYAGDAVMDQQAAAATGIPFVGINTGDDPFLPELPKAVELKGLRELPAWLGWA
jgi:phosphoglycolate phosphatase-like HAD superfamily hydrolase